MEITQTSSKSVILTIPWSVILSEALAALSREAMSKDLRFRMVAESIDRRSFDFALVRCAQDDTLELVLEKLARAHSEPSSKMTRPFASLTR
jgi:hypothetical protein